MPTPATRPLAGRLLPHQLADFVETMAVSYPNVAHELGVMELYLTRQTDRAAWVALLLTSVDQHHAAVEAEYEAELAAERAERAGRGPGPAASSFGGFGGFGGYDASLVMMMGPPRRAQLLPDVVLTHVRALGRRPDPTDGRLLLAALLAVLEVDQTLNPLPATADTYNDDMPDTGPYLTHIAQVLATTISSKTPPIPYSNLLADLLTVAAAGPFLATDAQLVALKAAMDVSAAVPDGPAQVRGFCTGALAELAALATTIDHLPNVTAYALRKLVVITYEYLRDDLRLPADALAFLTDYHYHDGDLRRLYLETLTAAGRTTDALATMRRWLAPGAPPLPPDEAQQWRTELLRHATTSGDGTLMQQTVAGQLAEMAVQGVLHPSDALRLWIVVRTSVTAADWPAARVATVAAIHAALRPIGRDYVRQYLDQLIEHTERQIDTDLATMARMPTWTLLKRYERFWLPDRAEALVGLYARALPARFDKTTAVARQDYHMMAQRLRALMDLPGCDEAVALLVEHLVTTYGRRSALLQELHAAGFSNTAPGAALPPIRLGAGNGEFDDEDAADVPAAPHGRQPNPANVRAGSFGAAPLAAKKRGRKPGSKNRPL